MRNLYSLTALTTKPLISLSSLKQNTVLTTLTKREGEISFLTKSSKRSEDEIHNVDKPDSILMKSSKTNIEEPIRI